MVGVHNASTRRIHPRNPDAPVTSFFVTFDFCVGDFRLEDDDDDEDFKKSQARTPSHPGKNNS